MVLKTLGDYLGLFLWQSILKKKLLCDGICEVQKLGFVFFEVQRKPVKIKIIFSLFSF